MKKKVKRKKPLRSERHTYFLLGSSVEVVLADEGGVELVSELKQTSRIFRNGWQSLDNLQ